MKLKVTQFCNLSTSPAFQAWLHSNYIESFNELISHLRLAKSCASNSDKMLAILKKLENINGGMQNLIRYLSKDFPYMIVDDGRTITQAAIAKSENKPIVNELFEYYDPELLSFPHKLIINEGDVEKRTIEIAKSKSVSDFIIINGVGYIEYLNENDNHNIPKENWEIAKYRKSKKGPLKVGFLYPTFALGGVERYTLSLCKALVNANVQFTGMGLIGNPWYGYGQSCEELSKLMVVYGGPNVDSHVAPDRGVVKFSTDEAVVNKIISDADVVIVWAIHEIPQALIDSGCKILVITHGAGPWTYEWLHKIADKCHIKVGVSSEAASVYDNPDEVNIIPAGIEIDRITPSDDKQKLRDKFGIPNDKLVIGYIGRFSSEKNCELIAKAVGAIPNSIGIFHGVGWWEQESLTRDIKEYADNRVMFFGPEYRTGDILNTFDCLVVASPSEGGPLVAMEAWLSSIPLVSTNVGVVAATTDLIGDVSVRINVDDDIETIAQAIMASVAPSNAPTVERARIYAWKHFTLASLQGRWTNLLANTVRKW